MTSEPTPVEGENAGPVTGPANVPGAGDSAGPSPTIEAPSSGAPHSFDQEFNRLNSVLANHSPHALRQMDPDAPRDAKEIEGWMRRVDKTLGRLRKRRSKRGNVTE